MKEYRSLASRDGRALVREIYRTLRFDEQLSTFTVLTSLWRICTIEKEVYRYSHHEAVVLHPMGIWRGTSLWMQEIVNRFHYSTINSFVYLGAALLLFVIGVRRFTDIVSDSIVLLSIVVESFLLVIMFVIMFFSPPESTEEETMIEEHDTSENHIDILREIGEISRDYAAVAMAMENAVATLQTLSQQHSILAESVERATTTAALTIAPNPELLNTMSGTNIALQTFQNTLIELNESTQKLQQEHITHAVRIEVERVLSSAIYNK